MKPLLIVAMIGGGMTGIFVNVLFGSGLTGPASPGSIFAVLIATPAGSFIGVILSVISSATVSLLIASVILRASRKRDLEVLANGDDKLVAAAAKMEALKGKESSVTGTLFAGAAAGTGTTVTGTKISHIVFACDAGMGSSAMGASVLRNKIKKAGLEGVTVENKAIANLDGTEDLIITHQDLTARARQKNDHAQHVSVDNFMGSPKYDDVVELVRQQQA